MICEFSVNSCEVFVNKKVFHFFFDSQFKNINLHHENQKVII